MSDPAVAGNVSGYQKLAKERAGLLERIEKYREFLKLREEIDRFGNHRPGSQGGRGFFWPWCGMNWRR
jgi:hypothetical protein